MKNAFTMIELIFVIVVLGILAAVAIPRYFAIGQRAHEANLISFVRTLNRTTGEELWGNSISSSHNGSVKYFTSIKQYVQIPKEINGTDISMENCGNGEYKKIAEANTTVTQKKYDILCKDGTPTTAPYFELIRVDDNNTLVSRD